MKITIELTDLEAKGIKQYLIDTDGSEGTKQEIKEYIQGIISTTLSAPQEAVSSYINEYK